DGAKAADLDQTRDRLRGAGDETPGVLTQKDLVIGNENGEHSLGLRLLQKRQRQFRLAGTGRAPEQNTLRPHHHDRRMMVLRRHQASAGNVTIKRAPAISPGLEPARFSAVRRPPCASMIWRLIDRPRPEFWPNASLAGRSL